LGLIKACFEKVYDKVKWSFLQQTLRIQGFDPKWCEWIKKIEKGSVGIYICVNNDIGHYFQTRKDLRQGILYHLFFLTSLRICLMFLLREPRRMVKSMDLYPTWLTGDISILQYVDDTIIFMEHDIEKALNMKLIMCIFEQLSGLKINHHKSMIFVLAKPKRPKMSIGCCLVAR
jgi:hypothetical protein